MALSDAELDDILRRCNAAAPGPWRAWIEGRDHTAGSSIVKTADPDREFEFTGSDADFDFIAQARQDVPRLVAEIRRLKALR